jgi:hypothetical protein
MSMKRVVCFAVTVVLAVGLFVAVPLPSTAPIPPEPLISPPLVKFSHPAGFYNDDFALTMSSNYNDAVIFYTTDGSVPNVEGAMDGSCESTERFRDEQPVRVQVPTTRRNMGIAATQVRVFSINAVAVVQGVSAELTVSRVPFTRNFVIGDDVFERFGEDTLIFALNSDPHGLYDHHDGIFVEGIDRELWRAENRRSADPPDPANFNRRGRESERNVHVEVFDHTGNLLLSQRAGMRVKGGWSRASTQKTVELYARREYSPNTNIFNYAFFGDTVLNHQGETLDEFRRIRLRNGGNDREFANVRDELSHTLFAQAGFPDTQQHTPTAIFLNGEYQGFSWLKTPRTEDHWQRRYGGNIENFEHMDGGDSEARYLPEHWGGNPRATEDWAEIVEIMRQGLTDSERWSEFSRRVCVDNLILYYALQVYIANDDFPGGNIEMWRYFPEEHEVDLHPFLADGRWRFIAQDIEFAWNLYNNGSNEASKNSIHSVLTGQGQMGGRGEMLAAVLERVEMRQKFADTLVELMEGAFRPANVVARLDELEAFAVAEVEFALIANLHMPENRNWPSSGSMASSRNDIRAFARQRPRNMVGFIDVTLGITVTLSY